MPPNEALKLLSVLHNVAGRNPQVGAFAWGSSLEQTQDAGTALVTKIIQYVLDKELISALDCLQTHCLVCKINTDNNKGSSDCL